MSIQNPGREELAIIAIALGDMNDKAVYVGGAVVYLYLQTGVAEELRPTEDVDLFFEITTLYALEELRVKLNERGFTQSAEDTVRCRFRYKGMKVDFMATEDLDWAPGNLWFKAGIRHRVEVVVADQRISILSFPFFLATKFAAFLDRGRHDPRTSHDLEDVIFLLDNRLDFGADIIESPYELKLFLLQNLRHLHQDSIMQEAVLAHLPAFKRTERYDRMMACIAELIRGI
jgi:predicted nucleotidyltransferase